MSTGQTFPDVIILPDGRVRLVTRNAQSWAWCWSDLRLQEFCTVDNLPRMLDSVPSYTPYDMQHDGLVVWWPKTGLWAYKEQVPEWRKKWPKWEGD